MMQKVYPRRTSQTPASPPPSLVPKVADPPRIKTVHRKSKEMGVQRPIKKVKFSAVRKHYDEILERETQIFDSMVGDEQKEQEEETGGFDHLWNDIEVQDLDQPLIRHHQRHSPQGSANNNNAINRFNDVYDQLHQQQQTILQDFNQPPYELHMPDVSAPFQMEQQQRSTDPYELFAAKVMMTEDQFMDPMGYIHCDNDPDYEEKKLARKEANSFRANDNQIAQCRPKGSSTLRSTYPRELLTCPCKCSMRNPSSELGLYKNLVNFYEKGWVKDGEHLGLFIPGFNHMGTKNCPAVIGVFRVEETAEGGYLFSFFDPGSGVLHCCPISWFYASFMDMVAEGHIPDTDAVAQQVREQICLKSNVSRFINVLAINVTFFQMSLNYRHDIGQHNLRHTPDDNGRVRVTFNEAQTAGVRFKNREQLARFFAQKAQPLWPHLNMIWMQMATRRIAQLEQANQALRASIALSAQQE